MGAIFGKRAKRRKTKNDKVTTLPDLSGTPATNSYVDEPRQPWKRDQPRPIDPDTWNHDQLNVESTRPTPAEINLQKHPTAKAGKKFFRAIYDFQPLNKDDLGFSKDDRLEVLEQKDKFGNPDWWVAVKVGTTRKGNIPSNYVVSDDSSIESQDWWFSVDRRDANKQLMLPGNGTGTFLIRNSTDTNAYALSVLDRTNSNQLFIRHYKIRKMDNGDVYITTRQIFKTLIELVEFLSSSTADDSGLKCRLVTPCPREVIPIPFQQLEVKRSDIQLGEELGSGNFGKVYTGKFCNVIDVAVKTLKRGSMSITDFINEAKTMNTLRHRRLVQLLGVCTAGEPLLIITELMSNGCLLDYIRKDGAKDSIKFGTLIDMAAQVADGMMYLEERKYIHRDLRAANILVGEHDFVKVADFGLARFVQSAYDGDDDENVYQTTEAKAKFPVKWTAPEAARGLVFSVKSDVWSFGILLYEIVTYGQVPYPSFDNSETLRAIADMGYRMPNPAVNSYNGEVECPESLYEIMMNCWHIEPQQRPTFEHLKNTLEDYPIATEHSYDEQFS